jgi:uncharacterized NAD(P)/FAD-binding protein YdhS
MNPIYHNMGMFILIVMILLDRAHAYIASRSSQPPTGSIITIPVLRTVTDAPISQTAQLSPVLQQLVDERRLYEMNLGKAMDTLRSDYSTILIQSPGTLHKIYTHAHCN